VKYEVFCALENTLAHLYLYVCVCMYMYVYRYRVSLWCFAKHKISPALRPYLKFGDQNSQSKPLNIILIMKYLWRPKSIFYFENFYYFLNGYKFCWSNDFCTIQSTQRIYICIFQRVEFNNHHAWCWMLTWLQGFIAFCILRY
jgi:hypothetical protein